jgi:hypothetical protein
MVNRDDLARVIRGTREFQAGAAFGVPAEAIDQCASGIADAVIDWLAGQDNGLRAAWEDRLAELLARRRTHGSVYMDGGHMPTPSERTAAREFMDDFYAAAPNPGPDQGDGVKAPAEPGMVAFEIEAVPHDPGNDGELWHKGTLPPAHVAQIFRDYAKQVETFTAPAQPGDGGDQ